MSAHSTSVQSQGGAFLQSSGGARAMTAARVYFDDTPYEFHVNLSDFTGWSQTEPAYFGEATSETSIPDLDIYELGTSTLWNTVDEVSTVDYSLTVGPQINASMTTETAPTSCPSSSSLGDALCESWWYEVNSPYGDTVYEYIGLAALTPSYPNQWPMSWTDMPNATGAILEDFVPYPVYVVSGDLYIRIGNIVYPLVIIMDVDVSSISIWAEDKFASREFYDAILDTTTYLYRDAYFANWTQQVVGDVITLTTSIYSCYQQLNDEITLYEA